ncbi:hypothetical protein [Tetragenococcus solitarius]
MLFLYQKTFIYQGMNCIFELSSFSYLDKTTESNNIRRALDVVLSKPENFTHDLKGTASTSQFTQAVIKQVQQQSFH